MCLGEKDEIRVENILGDEPTEKEKGGSLTGLIVNDIFTFLLLILLLESGGNVLY